MLEDVWKEVCFTSRSLRKEGSVLSLLKRLQKDLLKGTFQHKISCMWKSCISKASFGTGS